MAVLEPLETLFYGTTGPPEPLPPALLHLYGPLRFPRPADRPYVISNFVTTLDGVVSWNAAGQGGGGEISGHNPQDRMVMGLLRAVADAVVVAAGTLRSAPGHLWTAEAVSPALADAYRELRQALGRPGPPLNVIVTASGNLDLSRRLFQSGLVPVLVVTTDAGASRLAAAAALPRVEVVAAGPGPRLRAGAVLAAINQRRPNGLVLLEGGPQLLGDFLAERRLDELFLTISPQLAGRDEGGGRPGLVAGHSFAPAQPLWSTLASLKRAGSFLFARYADIGPR
jgi:riboflavin biosynthesis pyrimidine reductase